MYGIITGPVELFCVRKDYTHWNDERNSLFANKPLRSQCCPPTVNTTVVHEQMLPQCGVKTGTIAQTESSCLTYSTVCKQAYIHTIHFPFKINLLSCYVLMSQTCFKVLKIVILPYFFFLFSQQGQFTNPETPGYVGFANLPNQVHRKSVKKGFEFTLMVVGECIIAVFLNVSLFFLL